MTADPTVPTRAGWEFWIDRGGTFTDVVARRPDGTLVTHKLLSENPERYADAAVHAIREILELPDGAPIPANAIDAVKMGTTVATNALLERRGARVAYVGNAGFEHLLHLRRQTRAHLYRLCAEQPEPLVPLERCHGVRGRLGPEGELEALDLDSLPEPGEADAIAVCLLFAFRDPSHEQAVAAELRPVSYTHLTLPTN